MIDNGNKTMRATSKIALSCLCMEVPFVIENPLTSMIWETIEFRHLSRRQATRFWESDFCQWGTPWRKATGFLSGHCNPAGVEQKCRNGICLKSGHRHQVLAGVDKVSGLFWTHIAEAYPRGLASALARALHEGRLQLNQNRLQQQSQF